LGWKQGDLARHAKIGLATIQRLEKGDGPLLAHVTTALKIEACLRNSGVILLDSDAQGGVGVRLER
jgi:DNA-binding XRE family transcriptional regulator